MKTSSAPRAVLSLAAALLLPLAACTEAQKEQFAAQEETRLRRMAERQLGERANEYWGLLRWQGWEQAATYLQDEARQLEFLRARTTGPQPAIRDVSVDYVFVGSGAEEGEIRITWTEVAATEGRVSQHTGVQRWYKQQGRWWVDPDAPFGGPVAARPEPTGQEEPPPDLPTEQPR